MRRRTLSFLLTGLLLGCVEPTTSTDDDEGTAMDDDDSERPMPSASASSSPTPEPTPPDPGPADDDGSESSSTGAEPADCIETRFEALSWEDLEPDLPPGAPPPPPGPPPAPINLDFDLLPGCTVLPGGSAVLTVSCPVEGAWGNADLNYGCSQFTVAAPGNVLGSHGNEPPAGFEACGNRTIEDETVVCYQQCGDRLYEFEITSGSC